MTVRKPILLVVMGVSGSGKSTFTTAICHAPGLVSMDGDDLHSQQSVAKMQNGIALNDDDRWPWLDRIASYLSDTPCPTGLEPNNGKAVACSALKRAYRNRIRHSVNEGLRFVFLDGDRDLIHRRMTSRTGHFMQLELLDSQLATLERPGVDEEDIITVNTALAIDQLVADVIEALHLNSGLVSTSGK